MCITRAGIFSSFLRLSSLYFLVLQVILLVWCPSQSSLLLLSNLLPWSIRTFQDSDPWPGWFRRCIMCAFSLGFLSGFLFLSICPGFSWFTKYLMGLIPSVHRVIKRSAGWWAFSYQAPFLWDILTADIRESGSTEISKSELKSHLFAWRANPSVIPNPLITFTGT